MGRTKLFLLSLGVGILVKVFLLGGLLVLGSLFRETRDSMGMFLVYSIGWPIVVIRYLPGLTATAMVVISFVLASVLDVIILTVVTYLILKAMLAKRSRLKAPPRPPTF
jgi:uncharacterized membrane protein YhdT